MRIKKSILIALLLQPLLLYADQEVVLEKGREEIINFVDIHKTDIQYSLAEMEKKNLGSAKLDINPWVGYYWPLNRGLISYRWANNNIPRTESWEFYRDNVVNDPAANYITKGEINLLSPSEKYDLLLGDANFTLTKKMWDWAKIEIETFTKINTWAGLHPGLALATVNMPEPKSPVKIWSMAKKHLITFYPEDIKALGAIMWNLGSYGARTIGERCLEATPAKEESGRMVSPACQDVDPGLFHLAIVNQLGVAKKPLFMDSAFDEPVWNYPIVSYNYKFFNPNKPNEITNFQDAVIKPYKYEKDPFAAYRNSNPEYIVGVRMEVTTVPFAVPWSTANAVKEKPILYRYDLELDSNYNIISGEWYTQGRPDFIWEPAKDFEPKTSVEEFMDEKWAPDKEYIPSTWPSYSKDASKIGAVLSPVVKNLFWLSANGLNGYNVE
ncbi:MAG: hypothetical protein ACHQYQ_00290 [Bacteriovoracales bacterium]